MSERTYMRFQKTMNVIGVVLFTLIVISFVYRFIA